MGAINHSHGELKNLGAAASKAQSSIGKLAGELGGPEKVTKNDVDQAKLRVIEDRTAVQNDKLNLYAANAGGNASAAAKSQLQLGKDQQVLADDQANLKELQAQFAEQNPTKPAKSEPAHNGGWLKTIENFFAGW